MRTGPNQAPSAKRHFPIAVSCFLAVSLSWQPVLAGTTTLQPTMREAFAAADTVVLGAVTARRYTSVGDDAYPTTEYTVAVAETIAGEEHAELVLGMPGGRTERGTLIVPGIPYLSPGDEVLVALVQVDGRRHRLYSLDGGYFVRRQRGVIEGRDDKVLQTVSCESTSVYISHAASVDGDVDGGPRVALDESDVSEVDEPISWQQLAVVARQCGAAMERR